MCRSITIGDVSYNEVPHEAGMPAGRRWVKNDWDLADAEAQFEESQKPQPDTDGGWTSYGFIFGFPDPSPAEYLAYLREHGEVPETKEEVEVWVDAADLTRRVVTTSTTKIAEIGVTHRSATTSEYFDFGVAASIEAPPPREVIESEEWQWQEPSERAITPTCLH